MPQPSDPTEQPDPRSPSDEELPLLGDFEIIERIGQGAVGAVFKARQRSMDRLVAVKVLRPRLARDEAYVERFWREARAAARLSHPNIVLAIDAGEAHGYYYFAMEYVEGHPVSLLRKAAAFEERRALEIGLQIARALDYAWTQERIVHRDVKPGNIIITPDGTAKLADLGLAHDAALAEDDEPDSEGKVVGTPLYVAPEQIRREPDLDVRCDLYALGATLFHMVCGRPPYRGGDSKAILRKHLHEPVPDPRELRPILGGGIVHILRKLLAKDRDDRYPDAKALCADIEAVLDTGQLPAKGTRPARALRRPLPRRPRATVPHVVVACLVLAALGLAALAVWWLHRRAAGPSTAGPGPGVATSAAIEQPSAAGDAYEKAMAFVQAHPGEYVKGIALLRAVEAEYRGTTHAKLALGRREQLERALAAKAQQALRGLASTAAKLVAGGDYVGALAAFDRFPQALASREWRRRVAAERAATARQASKRFAAVLAPAAKAAADGRLDEALRLYQGVRGSLLPGWRDELAGRVAAVRRRQQERAEREKVEAEAAHLRLLARVARLYKERQYGAAAALLKAKLDATTAARRAERERELAEIAHLESFWRSVAKGAAAFIGKPYSIRGIPGTISSVKDGRIEISTRGRPFREELIKLGTADAAKFARAALRGTEGSLAVARFLIAEGAAAEARARLAELEAAGADVAGSRERLERLRRSEVLGEATAALEKARQATDRAAALRDFVARYKGEPAAAALCAEAARMLKESPGPGPAPAATGPLPARLRVACDGAYKLFLNGKQIAAGAGYREGQFDLGELEVKHGDVLACEAVSRSAHRAFYALLSVGGGRYAIATQGSWRTSRDAPDGWQTAAEPPGTWREATLAYSPHAKPGYGEIARELPGYWVWGEGERCLFHKVVRFGRTVAERAAAERERERRLTEEHGESADARLRLECGGSYRLYHNGALVGCAAAAVPGVSYALSVRQGDVVGVHAVGGEQEGWLETRVEVDGCPVSLRSDRSWVYASAPEAEGWHKRGAPGGVWRAARSAGGGGHRIWGRGRAVLFRKTIDLAKLRSRHPEVALRVHGRMEGRGERRATVVYDFAEPEQLADWHGQEPPTWSQGRMHVGRGAVFTSLLDTRELEVEAALEPIGDFLLGLWGDEPGARSGYTLSVVGDRRATVVLRRGSHALWMEKVAVGSTVPRRITLRRYNRLFIVQINGRKVFSVRDTHPLPDGDVRRVGFMTGSRSKVGVRSFRLEGRLASARPNDRSPPRERPRRGDWPPWRRRDRERD